MAGAYYEKIARINLTTGEIKVEPLDLELAHKFIGVSKTECRGGHWPPVSSGGFRRAASGRPYNFYREQFVF